MGIKLRNIFILFFSAITLLSCNDTDCPLSNSVYATYGLYNSKTNAALTLKDTLSVTAQGTDSVLLNMATGITSVDLPVSYASSSDTLTFRFTRSTGTTDYQIVIHHTNEPYFESIECGTSVFHTVSKIEFERLKSTEPIPFNIDSIGITNKKINYEKTENFKLYIGNN